MQLFQRSLLLSAMLIILGVANVSAEIDAMTGLECVDQHENCPFWGATGECEANPKWMYTNCRLSCKRCNVIRVNSQEEMAAMIALKQKEVADKQKAKRALAGLDEL
mmetsp:Transcript_14835/g.41988  ORF Transcript_14835/g.41988 Transcript_14835/m.41988 type:complete len:107 (-) Transcript_14835:390-710(-)|eukprot:CAMPEP_0119546188 /NCGR_PEP_ID=MMETSP1352-20130426/708_1 /TAXON_ID=265584 /ORGANISM="Stauroneis constricta, Strain CCMP1120" /LENGTH=106 /DNA_ID=CAMNT_0007590857 /DNA_START=43 /DNA_END=363 /DNA_ORIENTATION=+